MLSLSQLEDTRLSDQESELKPSQTQWPQLTRWLKEVPEFPPVSASRVLSVPLSCISVHNCKSVL